VCVCVDPGWCMVHLPITRQAAVPSSQHAPALCRPPRHPPPTPPGTPVQCGKSLAPGTIMPPPPPPAAPVLPPNPPPPPPRTYPSLCLVSAHCGRGPERTQYAPVRGTGGAPCQPLIEAAGQAPSALRPARGTGGPCTASLQHAPCTFAASQLPPLACTMYDVPAYMHVCTVLHLSCMHAYAIHSWVHAYGTRPPACLPAKLLLLAKMGGGRRAHVPMMYGRRPPTSAASAAPRGSSEARRTTTAPTRTTTPTACEWPARPNTHLPMRGC
jgi:hypothetical protein